MKHLKDFELKNYTSFKIGGKARNVYLPETIAEFEELLAKLKEPLILGCMSNVIISSTGITRDLILTKKLTKLSIKDNIITVQAGVSGPVISKQAALACLSGTEFMCALPGTAGGMVCMNASAHNQSISDIFKSALVFDKSDNSIKKLKKSDMFFEYRKSILQNGGFILLEAEFELKPADEKLIIEKMQVNKEFRIKCQPDWKKPNCGSVFKNPQNESAGRLLDEAGAKLLHSGGASVYEKHANFIINNGNAVSEDVSKLMKKMYDKVKEKFDVKLEPEVKFAGEMSEVEKEIWNEFLNR